MSEDSALQPKYDDGYGDDDGNDNNDDDDKENNGDDDGGDKSAPFPARPAPK